MTIARKSLLICVITTITALVNGPSASATSPVEVIKHPEHIHCTSILTPCRLHVEGEETLFFHIFGIESTEARCHVEREGRIFETGNVEIYTRIKKNGGHGESNCETVAPSCAGSLPWVGSMENDSGTVTIHSDVCVDPSEAGTCTGEEIMSVVETGGETPAQHFESTDLRIGSSSFCEVTHDSEVEAPVAPHTRVHVIKN